MKLQKYFIIETVLLQIVSGVTVGFVSWV